MDIKLEATAEDYRRHVRSVLEQELPKDWRGVAALDPDQRARFDETWRAFLVKHSLIAPGWPSDYGGGGLDITSQSIVAEEFVRAGAPHQVLPTDAVGLTLLGPTVLHYGTEAQKEYFIPRTISAEIRWAQGYSEPEAGSDLFGLRTRAVLDGDQWVINGSKIWQTAGAKANWIFALVRTDPDAPKARGLSFLLIPYDQPGVEVRAIKTMDGGEEVAEVFFDDARTSADNIIGSPGDGAKVALTLLGFERGAGGIAAAVAAKLELLRLRDAMRSFGVADDVRLRHRLADCWTSVHAMHCLALRNLTVTASGRPPGPESSITKLMMSEYRKRVTELAVDVLGPRALTPKGMPSVVDRGPQPLGMDADSSSAWVADYLHARPGTVYGGSSEIQRNTIGEKILGLPREPRPTPATKAG
ncbi:acyl-CoA dehydrogenase family protein [Streptomyces sp. NPDC097610]|uniref:acyl-CoA dehydrogenase family protein n=1 Tax=Streptomyces sp. NPDC097610 TaxID=3157227 RepID=UPI003331FEC4